MQGLGKLKAETDRVAGRKTLMSTQIALQRPRFITSSVDLVSGDMIVGQLHDVIHVIVSPTDMQNVHEAVMRPRDRFERRHSLELALKRPFAFKSCAVDHFHRAPRSG